MEIIKTESRLYFLKPKDENIKNRLKSSNFTSCYIAVCVWLSVAISFENVNFHRCGCCRNADCRNV